MAKPCNEVVTKFGLAFSLCQTLWVWLISIFLHFLLFFLKSKPHKLSFSPDLPLPVMVTAVDLPKMVAACVKSPEELRYSDSMKMWCGSNCHALKSSLIYSWLIRPFEPASNGQWRNCTFASAGFFHNPVCVWGSGPKPGLINSCNKIQYVLSILLITHALTAAESHRANELC